MCLAMFSMLIDVTQKYCFPDLPFLQGYQQCVSHCLPKISGPCPTVSNTHTVALSWQCIHTHFNLHRCAYYLNKIISPIMIPYYHKSGNFHVTFLIFEK